MTLVNNFRVSAMHAVHGLILNSLESCSSAAPLLSATLEGFWGSCIETREPMEGSTAHYGFFWCSLCHFGLGGGAEARSTWTGNLKVQLTPRSIGAPLTRPWTDVADFDAILEWPLPAATCCGAISSFDILAMGSTWLWHCTLQ